MRFRDWMTELTILQSQSLMYMNLLLKQDDKFFFPNQGEPGEHEGRKGSGSEQPSKGKKKPVTGDKYKYSSYVKVHLIDRVLC